MASPSTLRKFPRALQGIKWPQTLRQISTTTTGVEQHEPGGYSADDSIPLRTTTSADRKENIRNAQPFSEFLTDNFHRQHDYLRISVTEKCNLRCLYCMPEEGVDLSPSKTQLTTPEIHYLSALFVNQGVNKIRLTGGEPTVRKDIVPLMQKIGSLRRNGLKELALTTNAISLHRKLDAMVDAGLTGVNISLDTLDPFEFQLLTRRQGFEAVMKSISRVQEMNKLGAGIKLKINAVVMRGLNSHQVLPFVEMTRDQDVEVRFIEYMPFGGNKWSEQKMLPYAEMLDMIREEHPTLARMQDAKNDTSKTWHIPGFKGRIGFITSMTHNFCGTCNRLRITSDGNLKVCLHGNAEVSLRDLLRETNAGEPMDEEAFEAVRQIELDRQRDRSFAFDGEESWMTRETRLLNVIGAAVKRKKEKHAGESHAPKPWRLMPEIRPRQLSTVPNPMPFSSRIPVHLLSASSSLRHQVRCYTSDIKHPPAQQGEQETPASEQIAFQSLGSLFRQPLGGPYSRLRMAEENAQRNVSEQSGGTGTTEDSATTKDNSTTFRFFLSVGIGTTRRIRA
nr:isoform mocs1a of molybdenum cofactor biosynthesis protein 1 [Quercus suber]